MPLFEQTAVYLSMRKLLSMCFFSRVRERADVRVFYVRVDARYGVERDRQSSHTSASIIVSVFVCYCVLECCVFECM